MTNPDYTAIQIVVDRSGSMDSIRTDMEGAIASFVAEQAKVPGKCTVRLVEFDSEYNEVYPSTDVRDVKPYRLQPRGMTALLDAIGRSVTELGQELRALPESYRPAKVQVIVVTDGFENSSREWSKEKVRELIKQQTDVYDWDFVYLGANQDAVLTGADYGFAAGKSLTFDASTAGVTGTSTVLTSYTTAYRGAKGKNAEFSLADREAASGLVNPTKSV